MLVQDCDDLAGGRTAGAAQSHGKGSPDVKGREDQVSIAAGQLSVRLRGEGVHSWDDP